MNSKKRTREDILSEISTKKSFIKIQKEELGKLENELETIDEKSRIYCQIYWKNLFPITRKYNINLWDKIIDESLTAPQRCQTEQECRTRIYRSRIYDQVVLFQFQYDEEIIFCDSCFDD